MKKYNNKMDNGYLKIILGCMYAGKTSKLINIYNMMKLSNISTMVIAKIRSKESSLFVNPKIIPDNK